jgi:hypothetical protein
MTRHGSRTAVARLPMKGRRCSTTWPVAASTVNDPPSSGMPDHDTNTWVSFDDTVPGWAGAVTGMSAGTTAVPHARSPVPSSKP